MDRTLEQLLIDEKPDAVAGAQAIAKDILLNIRLAELRGKVQKIQAKMARNLGIKQPTVAGMEKPGRNLKLSTLERYVEVTGGELRFDVELPGGSHYELISQCKVERLYNNPER